LGCVFYYVMTQGRHPFDIGGTSLGRDLNIKENRFSTDDLRLYSYSYDADDLVMQMLQHEPRDRPDTVGILKHPYFWSIEDKLDFICDVSDRYEVQKNSVKNIHDENAIRTPPELAALEEIKHLEDLAPNVIGPSNDWLRALPRSFLTEMGKQRKYSGNRMIDLLRVIRNKRNHFLDLPEDVRALMTVNDGPVEGEKRLPSTRGYYEFWEKRFPSLLVNCHCLLVERGVVGGWRMERYF
jgi:serine/threonine-protein kinase/endoribonuclease IRE1